jgi:hypothetical protein
MLVALTFFSQDWIVLLKGQFSLFVDCVPSIIYIIELSIFSSISNMSFFKVVTIFVISMFSLLAVPFSIALVIESIELARFLVIFSLPTSRACQFYNPLLLPKEKGEGLIKIELHECELSTVTSGILKTLMVTVIWKLEVDRTHRRS